MTAGVLGLAAAALLWRALWAVPGAAGPLAYAYPPPATQTAAPPPGLVHLATSAAFSDTVAVIHAASAVPIFSLTCGTCWRPFAASPSAGTLSQIAVAPRADGTVRFLVAVNGQGLYRTGDAGQSWALQTFPHPGSCTEPDQFRDLIASPRDPRRLYLTVACAAADPLGGADYAAIYTSPDSGLTWQLIRGGGQTGELWQAFTLAPSLAGRLYALGRTGWAQSDDAGQTWQARSFPVLTLAVDAQNPEWLYGLNLHGVAGDTGQRSQDGGLNWSEWANQPCPAALDDKQLLAHPTEPAVLYLLCHQGLYRSRDGGDHWTQLSAERGERLLADLGRPGRLLWARAGGLWASTDAGDTWAALVTTWTQLTPCQFLFLPAVSK